MMPFLPSILRYSRSFLLPSRSIQVLIMISHLLCTPPSIIILLGNVYQFHSCPPLLLLVKYNIALIDVNYFSLYS